MEQFWEHQLRSVQSLSCVQLFVTPWIVAHQAFLSITNSWNLRKFMSIKSVMPSNHLIFCHPLLLCLQPFPTSESFPVSQFFASGGQIVGVSASALVLPMNIQHWFPLGWTGKNFFQSKGLLRVSPTLQLKSINSLVLSFHYSPTLTSIHDYWKNHSFDKPGFVGKVMTLLFNMLSVSNRKIILTYIHRNY